MSAVTIRSDFRAQEEDICHYFYLFLVYLPWSNGGRCHDLSFVVVVVVLIFSLKSGLLLSSFKSLIKKLMSSSLLSAIRVVLAT